MLIMSFKNLSNYINGINQMVKLSEHEALDGGDHTEVDHTEVDIMVAMCKMKMLMMEVLSAGADPIEFDKVMALVEDEETFMRTLCTPIGYEKIRTTLYTALGLDVPVGASPMADFDAKAVMTGMHDVFQTLEAEMGDHFDIEKVMRILYCDDRGEESVTDMEMMIALNKEISGPTGIKPLVDRLLNQLLEEIGIKRDE